MTQRHGDQDRHNIFSGKIEAPARACWNRERQRQRPRPAGLGDLEEARDAEAAPFARRLRCCPARRETRDIGARERLVEHGREIAAVISGSDRSLVGDARGWDEVAAADRDAIDAGDARKLVDQPLKAVIRLGAPRAAVGPGRHRVGEA